MKPFTAEGDVWRFLAGEFEKVRSTKYSCGGVCSALRRMYYGNLIGSRAFLQELEQHLQMLEPTATDCVDYQTYHLSWWWPLYDRKTGRAERALACAFLAVLADEGEAFDAPA